MAGTVIEKGETPNSQELFFVNTGETGKGGYIQYEQDGTVIARVSEVYRSNEYFENPEAVTESIKSGEKIEEKFPVDDWEVSLGKARIMGRFKDGMIQRVNSSPRPGTEVEKADKQKVVKFLGLEENGLNLGKVQQQDVEASINITDTLQKHFAILAQSGAGKSYTASVLLEELLDRDTAPAIVAVDPHGDYTCFSEDPNYMKDVKVFRESNISIAVNKLSAEQISMFLNGNLSGPQAEELHEIFSELNRGENTDYDLETIMNEVKKKEMNEKVKYALLRKLRKLDAMNIFGKVNKPSSKDLEPGKLVILDLSDSINNLKKQIIAAYFGKRFFTQRRKNSIPPFLYLIEEAHNFAPEKAPVPSRSVLEKIAREGRKFHAAIGLISQRPVRLSTTALSQCNTQFILRVTNPNDLDHISQSSEGITSDVTRQIPGLKTGEAIVIGEAVNHPTFIDVRTRKSQESDKGESLEQVLKDWEKEQEQKDKDAEAFM